MNQLEEFRNTRRQLLEIVNKNKNIKEVFENYTDDIRKIEEEEYAPKIEQLKALDLPTDDLEREILDEKIKCTKFYIKEAQIANLENPQFNRLVQFRDWDHYIMSAKTYGTKKLARIRYEELIQEAEQKAVAYAQELVRAAWEEECQTIKANADQKLMDYYKLMESETNKIFDNIDTQKEE